ncbi:hypothetical protein [Ensifer canadensis]
MFASSLLLLPATACWFCRQHQRRCPAWATSIVSVAAVTASRSTWCSTACMIAFFAFFYTAIVFNPKDTADNLKKHGGFIPGIRPGERTAEYIDYVLTRITVLGAIYLIFVCILPEILIAQTGVPF